MYWPPWYCAQWAGQQYVQGPVPVNGLYGYPTQGMPPQQWGWGYGPPGYGWPGMGTTPPPPYTAPAPAAEERKEEKAEEKKEEGQEAGKAPENPDAPPKLDEGVNYMFDTGHTMLHIFNKAAPVWEEKYHKQELHVLHPHRGFWRDYADLLNSKALQDVQDPDILHAEARDRESLAESRR